MCITIYKRYKSVLDKIAKRFSGLQKICRGIALLDAILGLMILIILLVRRIRSKSLNSNEDLDSRTDRIIVLVLQLFEIIFALILYEGVRNRVSCMIKTWLIYCLIRILIAIFRVVFNRSELRLWRISIEMTLTVFHIVQGLFILALQNDNSSTESPANPEQELDEFSEINPENDVQVVIIQHPED